MKPKERAKKGKTYQMTLYMPVTKAFTPIPEPSQNFFHSKL